LHKNGFNDFKASLHFFARRVILHSDIAPEVSLTNENKGINLLFQTGFEMAQTEIRASFLSSWNKEAARKRFFRHRSLFVNFIGKRKPKIMNIINTILSIPKILGLARLVKRAKKTKTGEGLNSMMIRWNEKNPHYISLPDPVTCAEDAADPIWVFFITIPAMFLSCGVAIGIIYGWEWPPAPIYYILFLCTIISPFTGLHIVHLSSGYRGWRLSHNIVWMFMQRAGRFCEVITLLSKYSRKKFSLKWTTEEVESEAVRILKKQARVITEIQRGMVLESVHGKVPMWGEAYKGQLRKEKEEQEQSEQSRFNDLLKNFLDVADIPTGREAYFPPPTS